MTRRLASVNGLLVLSLATMAAADGTGGPQPPSLDPEVKPSDELPGEAQVDRSTLPAMATAVFHPADRATSIEAPPRVTVHLREVPLAAEVPEGLTPFSHIQGEHLEHQPVAGDAGASLTDRGPVDLPQPGPTPQATGAAKFYADIPNSLDGPFPSLAAGLAYYVNRDSNGSNRWGDHSGAAYDWTTQHFWGAVEYAGVTLETSGSSGDTRLYLYDSNLHLIDFDDDGGSGAFSRLVTNCNLFPLPTGTYYAKVDEYGNNDFVAGYYLDFGGGSCSGVVFADNFERGTVRWSSVVP